MARIVSAAAFSWRPSRSFVAALTLVATLTLLRLAVLFISPIQLYPDEAQYWVWSRTLDWGYFSKPPMVAWLIALTTALGGDAEPWVRLSSSLLHAGAALLLHDVGRRLYSARVGLLAVVLYMLMPGVQLSCGIASTDAPLLFFVCCALWCYVRLVESAAGRACLGWGAGVGLALGLAFLSKYAAAYILAGVIWHGLSSDAARRAWRPRALLAAGLAFAAVLGPNLAWNTRHRFVTLAHTVENADWNATRFFHPGELLGFLAAQAGVFGPAAFGALLVGTVLVARRRGRTPLREEDRLLLCLTLPAIAAVSLQALLSRANDNWAFVAYGPGSVLAAAWLVRWRARGWVAASLGVQAALAAAFLAAAADPGVADRLGLANSLKRSRGWEEMTQAVLDRAAREPGLDAIAVDNRFLFNEMRYYGRERLAAAPPLKAWVRENRPGNHAEMTAPLQPNPGARVLAVSLTPDWTGQFMGDFQRSEARPPLSVRLDAKRTREAALFVGRGFWPRPRDSLTGLPTPP